uniref:DDE Tnp4 domain-containing protein n=1 Tax=Oncorhynchus mykiss TaxID=8022 RepID=A0A8C7RYK1_ONCMY
RRHLLKQELVTLVLRRRRQGRRRKLWVHPINVLRRELLLDPARHHRYFRMSAEEIETLLSFVGPDLTKQTTNYRTPIEPKQRLAVTLRLLASVDSICSLAFTYRLGFETVSQCIMETCEAIERKMLATHLPRPTVETWRQTSQEFQEKLDFPKCLGLVNGKHIRHFLYYKGTFSVVLLALVDANCRFTAIQVGDFGRNNAFLPGGKDLGNISYTMVGDAAFLLKPYLMRPYSGHNISYEKDILNYRLCLARMTVEKSFVILAARWRILYQKINLLPSKVDTLVVAMCILHNFLTKPCDVEMWRQQGGAGMRQGMRSIAIQANRVGQEAVSVRQKFTKYFISVEGRIDWLYIV